MRYNVMLFMLVLSVSMLFAENYVVVNSGNGIDVLSAVYYANAKGEPVKFMPLNAVVSLIAGKVGKNHDILLVQSKNLPANTFLEQELRAGNTVTVYETGEDAFKTNLELADRSGADSFIVIDPSFGQNALSVLPYAAMTKSYVVFAYNGNVNDVVSLLDRKAKKVTVFGYVDSVTTAKLAKYNPETIGKGEDKYEDNTIIVARELKISGSRPVVFLSDGAFVEEGMAEGKNPIVLLPRIAPPVTYNFIKESVKTGKFNSAILVGSQLTTTAYDLKKRVNSELQAEGFSGTPLGIVIKFGQAVGGSVQPLDMFPLPYYVIGLDIDSFQYNTATQKLELVVKSNADGPEYIQNQIRIKVNGVEVQALSDSDPQLLERFEKKGTEYSYALPAVEEGNITADLLVRFGETRSSLTDYAFKTSPVATISFTDKSLVEPLAVSYNKDTEVLVVSVKNNGTQAAYSTVAVSLTVKGEPATVRSDGVSKVDKGSITSVQLPVQLSEGDLRANKDVKVTLAYGAREGFLQKTAEAVLQLKSEEKPKKLDMTTILLILLVIILLLALVYFATRKKK